MYYRKMREIAETVTETEVKLTLPEQTSPKGNKFTIEGVVDIIRKNNTTTMYDIKTHDADYVNANKEDYIDQLNVYTHIWQNLRNEKLDGTAIIATQFPRALKKALDADDKDKRIRGTKQKFATRVCRNCDARFSCDAYREYAQVTNSFSGGFTEYINDLGNADEVENSTNTNALATPPPTDINDLI